MKNRASYSKWILNGKNINISRYTKLIYIPVKYVILFVSLTLNIKREVVKGEIFEFLPYIDFSRFHWHCHCRFGWSISFCMWYCKRRNRIYTDDYNILKTQDMLVASGLCESPYLIDKTSTIINYKFLLKYIVYP